MMNLNNLKNEYFAWIDKFDVITYKLENNKKKAPERKDLYRLVEDEDYYQFIMVDYYEDALEVYPEIKDLDMDKLKEEYEIYIEGTRNAIIERLTIYDEYLELNKAFDVWTRKVNMDRKTLYKLQEERNIKDIEWCDWNSNLFINATMMNSIELMDEDEVDKLISNAIKVLDMIGYTKDGNDCWEVAHYLDNLQFINSNLRHDIDDNCMSIFAVDILENRGLWLPDREHFEMGILKVLDVVDEVFLNWEAYYGE